MFTYHNYDNGTVAEGEVQTTGDGKLAHVD
jgi:hypothetical protein